MAVQFLAVQRPPQAGLVPRHAHLVQVAVVVCTGDGRVLSFLEKPRPEEIDTNLINAGMYVLEPDVLDLIPPGRAVSIEREVFPRLVEGVRDLPLDVQPKLLILLDGIWGCRNAAFVGAPLLGYRDFHPGWFPCR